MPKEIANWSNKVDGLPAEAELRIRHPLQLRLLQSGGLALIILGLLSKMNN